MIIVNISNIIKIFFFLQYPLPSNSCTYYILAGTFADLCFLNNQPLIRVLRQLNLVRPMSSIECPIRSYFQTLSFSLSFTFLILAAFDRYCFTLRRYSHRKLSNPHTGLRLIIIVTVTWIIFNTHQFFHHKLHNGIFAARLAHRYAARFMFIFFCIVLLTLLTFNILTVLILSYDSYFVSSTSIAIKVDIFVSNEVTLIGISANANGNE